MITPTRHYTLYEIAQEKLIPWLAEKPLKHAVVALSSIVRTDKFTNNYLKASLVPRGDKGVQYKIRGANLIKYLVNKE